MRVGLMVRNLGFRCTGTGPAPRRRPGPPNKLTFLKTATFVPNFKLWAPPDERLAPLSQLLCRQLCTGMTNSVLVGSSI